jgi:HEAT repeat protein
MLRDENLRKNDPKRVLEAIKQAGDLETAEAIDALTKLLTFSRPDIDDTNEIHIKTPAFQYPAVQALTSIGKRSLPALTEVIKEEDSNSLASNNAIFAILYFFRDEPAEGISYFEAASKTASSQGAAQRLLHVAQKIDELSKIK